MSSDYEVVDKRNQRIDFNEGYKRHAATHPYAGSSFVIMARITSATRDLWRFGVISGGGMVSSHVSSDELIASGYSLLPLSDCSVKMIYGAVEFFVTCDRPAQPHGWQPVPVPVL